MLLFFALSILIGTIKPAEYQRHQINAKNLALAWNAHESSQSVGYPVKVNFYQDDTNTVNNNKISIFSPGLYRPKKPTQKVQSIAETFDDLPERLKIGWLPGDFFAFDSKTSGQDQTNYRKTMTFGQNEDAFALIYCLNKLYDAGITEESGITLHAQCYGYQRTLHALYYLSNNEQTKTTEKFFLSTGLRGSSIDRIKREKLLAMIHSFCLQTPLKIASDGPVAIGHNKIIGKIEKSLLIGGACAHLGLHFITNTEKSSYINLTGIGLFSMPIIFSAMNRYFELDHYIIKKQFLPYVYSYDSNALSEKEMISRLDYFKKGNPHWSLFMTTAKNDRTVGDWGVAQFFDAFPVTNNRKFLVPSPEFGHCKVTNQQVFAKNAFLKWFDGSHYQLPEIALKQGQETLNFAQKGQSVNIQEYIEYMESHDNGLCH